MYFSEHCHRCEIIFGESFDYVHRWLDEFAKDDLVEHRKYRHHMDGVERVRKMWGDAAAVAAEQHIRDDFGGFILTKEWYLKNWITYRIDQENQFKEPRQS